MEEPTTKQLSETIEEATATITEEEIRISIVPQPQFSSIPQIEVLYCLCEKEANGGYSYKMKYKDEIF